MQTGKNQPLQEAEINRWMVKSSKLASHSQVSVCVSALCAFLQGICVCWRVCVFFSLVHFSLD